jgi:hypothetical protein
MFRSKLVMQQSTTFSHTQHQNRRAGKEETIDKNLSIQKSSNTKQNCRADRERKNAKYSRKR